MDNTEQLQKAVELIKNAESILDNCFSAHCAAVGISDEQAMNLKPHEIRVIIERNELSEKIGKLKGFLESGACGVEDGLMLDRQLKAMEQYQYILNLRIDSFMGQ